MQLKQISTISAGHSFRGKIEEKSDSNVIAVQMKNITDNGDIDWGGCVHTEVNSKKEPQWLVPSDILIVARGNQFYSVLVDEKMPSEFKALASPYFYVIRLKNQEILPKFLVWQLNQKICQRYFEKSTEGSFTKSIRRNVVEETPVIIPSLKKQQSILGLLEVLKKENKIIEKLKTRGEQINSLLANELIQ